MRRDIPEIVNILKRSGVECSEDCELAEDLAVMMDEVRLQAIGWTHADDCNSVDKGESIGGKEIPDMVKRFFFDFECGEIEEEEGL